MNHNDPQGNPTQDSQCSSSMDFGAGLNHGRALLEKGQVDKALDVLRELETNYVRASIIFEILGDAFLAKGEVSEGIRYKTLHQILAGTFKIAGEYNARGRAGHQGTALAPGETPYGAMPQEVAKPAEEEKAVEDVVPVTLSMAQELMRQGHYDRASRIFDRLLLQNPEEESLEKAREVARRKSRDKHLLNVFQRWLTNIQQIRSSESAAR